MKTIHLLVIILSITSFCFTNGEKENLENKNEIDYAWKDLNKDSLNLLLEKMISGNKRIVSHISSGMLFLFGNEKELGSVKIRLKFSPPEAQDTASICLIRDGYLDDQLRGEIFSIKLTKNSKKTWHFIEVKHSFVYWNFSSSSSYKKDIPFYEE